MLDLPQLAGLISQFQRTAFRLETLDSYAADSDGGYAYNVKAGQDVRILDLAERHRPAAVDVDHDFWLVDDQTLIRMHYTPYGEFSAAEPLAPAALPRYLAARDAALKAAEPFGSYWERHPEYHRAANPA